MLGVVNPLPYILQGVVPTVADNALGPDTFDSVRGKYLGTNMTGQERQNADLNFQNQLRMMREGPQAQVEGAERAGINPAFALTGQAHTPSAGNTSSMSSGGSLSDLIAIATLPAQLKLLDRQADLTSAQEGKTRSETDLNTQLIAFNDEINPLRKEAQEVSNSLGRATEKKVYAECDKISEDMKKIAAETETEATKQMYNIAAAGLADARAQEALALLPYSIALKKAETAQAKAMARLYGLQAMYQNRLINDGFLDALIAGQEANADMQKVKARIKSGKAFTVEDTGWLSRAWNFFAEASGLSKGVQVIDYILDKVNIFAPMVTKSYAPVSGFHDPFGYMNE